MITDSYAPLNTNIPSLGWWVVELNIRNTLSFIALITQQSLEIRTFANIQLLFSLYFLVLQN